MYFFFIKDVVLTNQVEPEVQVVQEDCQVQGEDNHIQTRQKILVSL